MSLLNVSVAAVGHVKDCIRSGDRSVRAAVVAQGRGTRGVEARRAQGVGIEHGWTSNGYYRVW